MNRKSTSYLVLAALALLTYILVYERHTPSSTSRAAAARQLLAGFVPARVDRVEIVGSNVVVRAERTRDQWRLLDPPYPAQSVLIEDWLATLSRQTRRAELSAAEVQAQPGGLAVLGLAEPFARVTLQQDDQRFQVRLGARTALGELGYLQFVGDDQVVVTESALWDRLPASASAWRDPVFVNLAGRRFDLVSVRSAGRGFELQRGATDGRWRVTQPRPARADNGRIDRLWLEMQSVLVAQFVNDFPGADLEPYGLQTPELSVAFAQGTNPVLSVDFGRSPTNAPGLVYARRSVASGIVLVPRTILEAWAVPYTQLLDMQLLDAPLTNLSRLEAHALEDFALARATNGSWRVVEPRELPADPAFVQIFLDRVKALRIARIEKEVVTDFDLPSYGLAQPARQYAFFVSDGAPAATNRLLARLDFGTNRDDEVFVRRSDENPVYVVKRADLQFFPLAAFELRDRRIWNFTTNEVAGLTLQIHGETRKLLRSPTGDWTFATGSQGMVNTFALEEAVFHLGQLFARAWVAPGGDELDRYGIPQIDHQLTVEFTNTAAQPLTVRFGATSRTGGPFAVTSLEIGPVVFEFPIEIYRYYEDVVSRMTFKPGGAP